MKYGQHNFAVSMIAKSPDLTTRMTEVFEIKAAIAKSFIESNYTFVIVGEDVVSNDLRLSAVINLIVSVVPKAAGTIPLSDEEHDLSNFIAKVLGDLGYRCIIAGEDMMSEFAKDKLIFIPKEV
jgi:hypothetical protein